MSDAPSPALTTGGPGSIFGSSRILLWAAFVLAHLWLGYLNIVVAPNGLNDVTVVYRQWAEQAVYAQYWVGIDGVFVYPILALAPMMLASVFGFAVYGGAWLSLVMVLDAVALAFLSAGRRPGASLTAAWWWIAFLVLLGPIAVGRIDAISVPVGIVAVLLIARRPRIATMLLTVGAWMKIWPAAIVAALFVVRRDRIRVVEAAAVTTVAIVALALAFGSGSNVFSFITLQTGRGLQVEAPVTTFWMWQAWAGVPGATVYYDLDILTYQVTGAGVGIVSSVMTPLLALVVAGLCALGYLSVRRGVEATRVLAPLSLALVVALIAVNKVGSPQFMAWIAVPVLLGIVTHNAGRGQSFRVPAGLVVLMALLTQLIYPYFYTNLIGLDPGMLVILTARNILTCVVLGWSVRALWQLYRSPVPAALPSASFPLATTAAHADSTPTPRE